MKTPALLSLALAVLAGSAQAHQLWIERDGDGPARVFVGDVDGERDRGEDVAKLAGTTRLFAADPAAPLKLTAHDDRLEAPAPAGADLRLVNDQVWKPWRAKDGTLKAAVFNAREGRRDTRAALDYEFVPAAPQGDRFTLVFKGQPVAGKTVTVVDPNQWAKRLKTDAEGRLALPARGPGRYVLVASHSVKEKRQVAGETVDAVDYTATLSFVAH